MQSPLVHYPHLAVILDVIIHITIIVLTVSAAVIVCRMIELVKKNTKNKGPIVCAYSLLLIVGFMAYNAILGWVWCAGHYAEWWHR